MEINQINQLKRELYTVVLKTVTTRLNEIPARQLIKEQLDKQLAERAVNPNIGLMIDLLA